MAAYLTAYLAAFPMALAYLALIALWSRTRILEGVQARLRAVGRMALTNYLAQSVLCGFVFYGYGLGLYGRLGRGPVLIVVAAVWALELIWSPLWLKRFSMGPVEWAWRKAASITA